MDNHGRQSPYRLGHLQRFIFKGSIKKLTTYGYICALYSIVVKAYGS